MAYFGTYEMVRLCVVGYVKTINIQYNICIWVSSHDLIIFSMTVTLSPLSKKGSYKATIFCIFFINEFSRLELQ